MNTFSSNKQVPSSRDHDSGNVAAVEDSFYGTLDLGYETQINNDLACAIRDEIAGIDKSLQSSSDKIKHEERSLAQLTKGCNHARDEMFAHRRDAMEGLDSENMTEELRVEFKAQFASEVAPHLVSPSSSPAHHDRDTNSPEDESNPTRGVSHKAFIDRKRVNARNKSASIHSIQQEIFMTRKKIKAAADETARLNQEMHARQLDRVKIEGERQLEAKRREYEAETQRYRGVKEAVQMARANSGAYAQQIAEKAKEQMAERRSYVSKETELASVNNSKQHELAILEADEKKLDSELAALSGQLDFLTKQVIDFQAAQSKSNEMKVVADEVRHDIAELTFIKDTKSKDAKASYAALQIVLTAFEEISKLADEANAMKLENETAVVDILCPANARKSNATKEKEKLAGKVVALQKTAETTQNSNQDAATSILESVSAKFDELEGHRAKLDTARVDLEEMSKLDATAHANLLNEKREYEGFSAKFEAATSVEISRLEELKHGRFVARQTYLENRRSDLDLLEQAHRDDIENLKQLRSYLKDMKDVKTMLEEKALLDENGIEVPLPDYDERVFGVDCDDCDDKDDIMSVHNEAGSPAVKRR